MPLPVIAPSRMDIHRGAMAQVRTFPHNEAQLRLVMNSFVPMGNLEDKQFWLKRSGMGNAGMITAFKPAL